MQTDILIGQWVIAVLVVMAFFVLEVWVVKEMRKTPLRRYRIQSALGSIDVKIRDGEKLSCLGCGKGVFNPVLAEGFADTPEDFDKKEQEGLPVLYRCCSCGGLINLTLIE
jgi:hypothetical protein